jgi:hypothetical protein
MNENSLTEFMMENIRKGISTTEKKIVDYDIKLFKYVKGEKLEEKNISSFLSQS